MKKKQAPTDRLTYSYLTLLNVCVAVLFFVVLLPAPPEPIVVATVVPPHSSFKPNVGTQRPITGTSVRVVVPSVGIDIPVKPGHYDSDSSTWTIDHSAAFHADVTVPVNNTNGTALIYGHAGWKIFGSLPNVKPGASAVVYTLEGNRFNYEAETNRQVDPHDTSALIATGPPKLLLQTCSGAFDAYRTLVSFKLVSVVRDE